MLTYCCYLLCHVETFHDDVIKWKHFPRYWPFVREIHRSPVNFPHKGQWRGALMFTLICARMNGWVNNREAGDLRRYLVHYDVIVMQQMFYHDTNSYTGKHKTYKWRNCTVEMFLRDDHIYVVCLLCTMMSITKKTRDDICSQRSEDCIDKTMF